MAQIPLIKSGSLTFDLFQTKLKSLLDPILGLPELSGLALTNVQLINGVTNINHKLSRMQQGFRITDINGSATIYRSQPFNSSQLTLTSSAAVTVNLWVW